MDGDERWDASRTPRAAQYGPRRRLTPPPPPAAGRATKLLFRDKRRALHLYDLATQTRSTLLSFSSYVQWVPNADVVVAQNRSNLCIWYHIDTPERVTVVPIKGDVEEIERGGGSTQVVVDEGMNTVSYELNEALISFGSAMEDGDLQGAANMLERLPLSPETEAMWEQLSALALQVRLGSRPTPLPHLSPTSLPHLSPRSDTPLPRICSARTC